MKKIITGFFLILSMFSFSENIVRKISVTGNSEREVAPDTAKISFQIQVKNQNLNNATKELKEKIEKFRSGLKVGKIEVTNFETVSFYSNRQKEYGYNSTENEYENYEDFKGKKNSGNSETKKKPASYTVQIKITVRNTDFGKLSALIDFTGNDSLKNIKKSDTDDNSYYFVLNDTDVSLNNAVNKTLNKFSSIKSKLQSSGITENNIVFDDYKVIENQNIQGENQDDVFIVTENFTVTTKSLKNLNDIISLADDNSININNSIYFDISDKDKIASEMYSEAFNQAKSKAASILKSSGMTLVSPLVVSEDAEFQRKMIERIDTEWTMRAEAMSAPIAENYTAKADIAHNKKSGTVNVDYTPKPIRLSQNISVMYEIK